MMKLRDGLAAVAMLAAAVAVQTGNVESRAKGGSEPYYRTQNLIDLHVRYPGDSSYSFGTTRHRGPDEGPYVEQCFWSANSTLFGVPFGFTQTCTRYTEENTN